MSRSKDSKCIKCAKKFLINKAQNLICCDNCNGWLHLKCAGLKLKEFKKICNDPNSNFLCDYCEFFKCGKCDRPVYEGQNSIECSVEDCGRWYHLRCTEFTLGEYVDTNSRLHMSPWFCPHCITLPFSSLNQLEFVETVSTDHVKKYFQSFPDRHLYSIPAALSALKNLMPISRQSLSSVLVAAPIPTENAVTYPTTAYLPVSHPIYVIGSVIHACAIDFPSK